MTTAAAPPLLSVSSLQKRFAIRRGVFGRASGAIRAVEGVSFDIGVRESLGLVGESGCGKTTIGRLVLRLITPDSGSIVFDGKDITNSSHSDLRAVRRDMQLVFQDPFSSLNPRLSVGKNVAEPLRVQKLMSARQRKQRVIDLFHQVGLREEQLDRLPHEFSGGQRQRVAIARALALEPKFLVLDEPVSALDVSVSAQVQNLLRALQRDLGLSYLFISHDLAVVRHLCDRVAVVYLGKIVEIGERGEMFTAPLHPYTNALLSSIPVPDPRARTSRERIRLSGDPPSPVHIPSGCRFRARCWKAQDICREVEPPLKLATPSASHWVACHFPQVADVPARSEAMKGGR